MNIDQVVKVHKALGDITRYKIVQTLADGKCLCVGHLGDSLNGIPLSTLSHHLKQLSDCGIIIPEKQGTYIFYKLNNDIVKQVCPELL
ncbi:metalloregulator ArsR/SmtB family transcription factor [Paenibacillus sp. PsM32]|uniref:ArsR/SmtB family transcription factor n=1 Tax=Paenibacillus sp. PsM32 TaxID=3030536 RepID=UPI00263A9146|nr:metalloregulator ArsR/SmtB family transcription factor [Paenibacillus sp. PsM32]MDN4618418.1 metalloregulator ArsR/SmtB family transcription factor [Paenibacillus sp. PsM32]